MLTHNSLTGLPPLDHCIPLCPVQNGMIKVVEALLPPFAASATATRAPSRTLSMQASLPELVWLGTSLLTLTLGPLTHTGALANVRPVVSLACAAIQTCSSISNSQNLSNNQKQ